MQKSIFMLLCVLSMFTTLAQDSGRIRGTVVGTGFSADTSMEARPDTSQLIYSGEKKTDEWTALLMENKSFNFSKEAEIYPQMPHHSENRTGFFYYLLGISLFLALQRSLFEKYFSNLFSLFFNLTLRRNQLRDQLMQARLPGLLLNFYFILVYGLLAFFLINYYLGQKSNEWKLLFFCTLGVAMIYLVKFAVLRFMGWLTGYVYDLNTYSFIVFLINKLTALLLLPVVMLLAFGDTTITTVGIVISIIILISSFLIRYVKGWGIVRAKTKLSAFHFFIYLLTIELLPLALLYKFATNYLSSYV